MARLTILATTLTFKLKRESLAAEKQSAARKIELTIDSTIKDEIDAHKHKRNAAKVVCDLFIKPEFVIGLGAGPAVYFVVEEMGAQIKKGKPNMNGVRVIACNSSIERHCTSLQIPTTQLSSIDVDSPVDLLIDGADEVDLSLNVLKGNTGSLIREKVRQGHQLSAVLTVHHGTVTTPPPSTLPVQMLWHSALQRVVVVTEESKLVKKLGLSCPLPVEVRGHALLDLSVEGRILLASLCMMSLTSPISTPKYSYSQISSWGDVYLKDLLVKVLPDCKHARGVLRTGSVSNHYSDGMRVAHTDGGNHVCDLYFDAPIQDPQTLSMVHTRLTYPAQEHLSLFLTPPFFPFYAQALDSVPGVVSHGLFVGYATTIVFADDKGVRIVGHAGEGLHRQKPETPWWDSKPPPRAFDTETVDNRKI